MKSKLLLIIAAFLTSYAYAQIDFTENIVIDTTYGGLNPSKVLAIDVDGDNFKDIISLANGVHWYKNIEGQGNFDKPIQVEFIDYAGLDFDVDAADLDGDNDVDLVYFIRDPDNVNLPVLVWAENLDGLGNFSENQSLRNLSSIGRLKVDILDVDNDGDFDITYSDYEEIGWLEIEVIDSEPIFTNHTLLTIPSTQRYDGYYFSDFNGDNLLDLVVDYQNFLSYYIHNPDNTVTYTQDLDTFSTGRYVIAEDVDDDNDNDVVSIKLDGANTRIEWYENTDGLGTFANAVTLVSLTDMVNANINSRNDIRFVDVDGDDIEDLLFSYFTTNKVSWYKNLGAANFGNEQIITSTTLGIKSFFASDINDDNTIDIVTSSLTDNQVGWFSNLDGLGTFGNLNLISKRVFGINDFDKGDMDRDGDLDLVVVSEDGKLSFFENIDGEGSFSEGQIVIDNALNFPGKAFVSDVDRDEDLDIVVWSYDDLFMIESSIFLFINDGEANFTRSTITSFTGFTDDVISKDFDGDFDLDVIGVLDGLSVFFIENNGDGSFEAAQTLAEGFTSITALGQGDIDNDGDIDIVISESGGNVTWLENTGELGSFIINQTIETNNDVISRIIVEDISVDGNKDILYYVDSSGNRKLEYLKNTDGQGDFGEPEIIVSIDDYFYTALNIMDFDNDNDLDVLAGAFNNSSDEIFLWHENLSDINSEHATFGPAITINDYGVANLKPIDIDNNGTLDLMVGLRDSLLWFENFSFPWNEVFGTVTIANGVDCDVNNPPFENVLIVADNGTNQYATFSQFNGVYQLIIEEPGLYNTTTLTPFSQSFSVTPDPYTSDFGQGFGVAELNNFCVEPIGIINDLEIAIFPITEEPRPGFNTTYRLVFTNAGPLVESGTITLEYNDDLLNFAAATAPVFSSSFGELEFQYSDLGSLETRVLDVDFLVEQPPLANDGDELNFTTLIDGTSDDDITPMNNSHQILQVLVNSYDPNDINVMEGDEILIEQADEYLHYLIRFQNTGTASAINVNVEHQLDEDLDWQSMRMQSLSHPGRVEITNGSMVNFIFDNIHLPDSTSNEPASHGHIAYKIKPKNNVVVGDVFSGVADIYFDFNAPITTNTVTTEIVEPLSVKEEELQRVSLYPNPANDKLEITSRLPMDGLSIIDINGRQLNSIETDTSVYSLDVKHLSKGIYFLEIQSGSVIITKKFIKN